MHQLNYFLEVLMWYEGLFDEAKSMRDDKQAVEMSRYMRNLFPFLGVPKPKRELLYKKYFVKLDKGIDWGFVDVCFGVEEREFQYFAIDYLVKQRKYLVIDDLDKLATLIRTRSWWDSVDGFPKLVGEIVRKYPIAKDRILEWSVDDNFWIRRVSIIFQLMFKGDTDVDLLEKIIVNNLGSKEFFINKAIGWILRDYSKTDKLWVADLIDRYRDRMANLSIREGSKYL